ncbi:dTDP-4-dehydrorhamnose reductase [Pengzhenrongella sicca]|uniref:dTDP-4-dehydrorhamnose reductase n=1 Tax=Pengzhenrongella sicca TaxID=2819238 RepID=A0A8A4ZE34_9MICO|nr:dTDP-4-dehydrorhamnose reductase [Pengzhenrongella sicca]QTE30250.1 dTDP-4-dehydrorhamnose reductase [Pengzhenrongella sicca]
MRWLVVGASGMLGQDVASTLTVRGHDVRTTGRSVLDGDALNGHRALDITDADACLAAAAGADVVMNCAAYTAVDAAETDEAAAFAVNAVGAANLARAARRAGARLVQISTDYVFDGGASTPYAADAALAPRSAYGRTKAAGEWAVRAEASDVLVVRTAWLYGAGGRCFPKTIARVAAERGGLDVVADQVGQPTWTMDLADLVVRLVEANVPGGTYHGTSSGQASWHEFAREVVAAAGLDPQIVRTTTSAAYVAPAPRPDYSVLGHGSLEAAGVTPIGPWRDRWAAASAAVLAPAVEAR